MMATKRSTDVRMSYLNTVIGGTANEDYSVSGIQRIALAPRSSIATITKSTSGGSITDLTMVDTAKFYEVTFIPDTAKLGDVYTVQGTNRYMAQSLSFTIFGNDDATIAAGKKIHLGRFYSALFQRADGKWYLLGDSMGLNCSVGTANDDGDDSNRPFTLSGKNLGHALPVTDPTVVDLIETGS
ncbi:hypothetical protein Q5H93_06255 [Hymenobacter sp. ASUV-10]|uniref:Uncharacterized protein n=1 Tax=Hymenobacter aranciens TaxID=3063996 RepID=A0ABT9B9I9_9BACT|nr:hypothetical protein [Hymenobacter sp. ASUV-10]MDO7874328.1 hypothetical protein [Hymenobacter sp. ASUV-10]